MNRLNRVLLAADSNWLFPKIVFGLVGIILLCGVHPLLGGAVLAVAGVLHVSAAVRSSRRSWAPNFHGENPYQILGVPMSADGPTIRRAFRELEQQYHPDAAPPDRKAEATAVFVRLNQAYEVLTSREMRFQYDGLILEDGGRLPPFDEAYRRIKDEDRHPMYAEYDAVYGPRPSADGPGDWGPEAPPPAAPAGPPTGEAAAAEVDMPEAVREALGLPPRPPPA